MNYILCTKKRNWICCVQFLLLSNNQGILTSAVVFLEHTTVKRWQILSPNIQVPSLEALPSDVSWYIATGTLLVWKLFYRNKWLGIGWDHGPLQAANTICWCLIMQFLLAPTCTITALKLGFSCSLSTSLFDVGWAKLGFLWPDQDFNPALQPERLDNHSLHTSQWERKYAIWSIKGSTITRNLSLHHLESCVLGLCHFLI